MHGRWKPSRNSPPCTNRSWATTRGIYGLFAAEYNPNVYPLVGDELFGAFTLVAPSAEFKLRRLNTPVRAGPFMHLYTIIMARHSEQVDLFDEEQAISRNLDEMSLSEEQRAFIEGWTRREINVVEVRSPGVGEDWGGSGSADEH